MTPTQLARALASVAPPLQRALLAQLAAWESQGRRASLREVEQAVAAGDTRTVVRLLLGASVADVIVLAPPSLPNPLRAFIPTDTPAAIAAASRSEAALVRSMAEAAVRASSLASAALPPRPPRLPSATVPTPAPLSGVLTISRPATVATTTGPTIYAREALSYLRGTAHAGVEAAVRDGLARGINPRDVARGLRDVVGLGDSQAVWVSNLRTELEGGQLRQALDRKLVNGPIRRTLEARLRTGKPLTAAEIDKVVGTYAQKWRAWHAETVSRTMTLDLLRHGSLARAREAVARGDYGDEPVTKRWVTRLDGREREAHRLLNGTTRALNEVWMDDGVQRQVPGGWNCRCAVVIRMGV